MVTIAVPSETTADEARVALVPESVAKLVKAGARVIVQRGAGDRAGFPDDAYVKAGATLAADAAAAFADAAVVVHVRRPTAQEAALLREGTVLIALLQPSASADLFAALAARKVSALALERVPRITRAQSMDVLSSQSTASGYKAVLIGAAALGKFLPMLTTAAGSIRPAQVFIIGAGVAGLQAIATARRLGGVVSAFDVRAAAAEQVKSLGATFVATDLVSASAEDKGGYAKAQAEDERARTLDAIGKHIVSQDLVVTTALIPGKPAPVLITAAMVKGDAARRGDRGPRRGSRRQLRAHQARRDRRRERRHDHRRDEPRGHGAAARQRDAEPQCAHAASALDEGRRDRDRSRRGDHEGDARHARRSDPVSLTLLQLYVFVLAAFVGFLVITRVPPLLHTPLMSATNAISAISLVGSLVAAGSNKGTVSTVLGFIAVAAAMTNVVGGFIITDRMLKMFKREPAPGKSTASPESQVPSSK